jgi:hypothetical protein
MGGSLGFILLIAGIIIGAVHPALFAGVYSLSTVLILVGIVLVGLQIVFGTIAALSAAKKMKQMDRRNRRGF